MIDYSLNFNSVVDFHAKVKSALQFLVQIEYIGEGNGFGNIIKTFAPDLLDNPYCTKLGNEFEQEIRENFHRFTETKRQDRYSGELFGLLKHSLDTAFSKIKEYQNFAENADDVLVNGDGGRITGKALEDSLAVQDSLHNLNKIRLPIHKLLKSNAPEEWQQYYNLLNSVSQEPQPTETNKTTKVQPPEKLPTLAKGIDLMEYVKETTYYILPVVDNWVYGENDENNLLLEETPYYKKYGHSIGPERIDEIEDLDKEIRSFFLSLDDSKTQERYGRYLLDIYKYPVKYTVDLIESKLKYVNDIAATYDWSNWPTQSKHKKSHLDFVEYINAIPKRQDRTEEQKNFLHAISFLGGLQEHLLDWLRTIKENLICFVPEVLNEYRESVVGNQPANPIANITPNESGIKGQWKNLPPKILLLDKLGFFKLPEVQKLSFESKGKLISTLCGGSADNAVDYIRHCDPERTALENNPYRNQKNVNAVDELMALLNRS
ncbi:hypothetical protein [Spirosoma luteum]|uniref:hypothetical protein n=1 Tax=Spirosoma luteum TaxID=431553 RepID=UPI00036C4B25|nr:hypothetical protein [Spirosoma luteum]